MNKYTFEDFEAAVVLFNRCCGSKVCSDEYTTEENLAIIRKQARIIQEEINELALAMIDGDKVEMIDAVADVTYTVAWLGRMDVEDYIDDSMKSWLTSINEIIRAGVEPISDDQFMTALERVATNNAMKFTTDVALARQWESNSVEGYKMSSVEVEGVIYYCLKDNNGKVRKWNDFPKVDLSDLV